MSKSGKSELHIAAESGDLPLVISLLSAGTSPNLQDDFGRTPLHYAVGGGYYKILVKLINSRANLDIKDSSGATALLTAIKEGYVALATLLIDAGAIKEGYIITDGSIKTPLELAVLSKNPKMVSLVVNKIGPEDMAKFLFYVPAAYSLDEFSKLWDAYTKAIYSATSPAPPDEKFTEEESESNIEPGGATSIKAHLIGDL